ncbi:MAG: permease, partial [Phycisphaerales bacterium]|nr:permease [Phycisphaerales bacterium]
MGPLAPLADGTRTALGFFWKAGWAFVLGYFISAMIQSFVPKSRLTRHMGDAGPRSVLLSTGFGAVSSSCSFAALSAARALVQKGAHFVAAVAFMFASTNLVIELGILIFVFLGPSFVVAELVGGLVMIAVSTTLVRWTY